MADAFATSASLYALSAVCATPLDVYKCRIQYCTFYRKAGRLNMKTFMKLRWWKGMNANIMHTMFSPLAFSWWYNKTKHEGPFFAGLQARAVATFFAHPFEMWRTFKATGLYGYPAFKRSILFRGMTATLMRDLSFAAVYWGALVGCVNIGICQQTESEKKRWDNNKMYQDGLLLSLYNNIIREPLTAPDKFFCAFLAASAATVVSHPFDCLKSHVQTFPCGHKINGRLRFEPHSLRKSFNMLTTTINVHGGSLRTTKYLWTGLLPRFLRTVPMLTVLGAFVFEYGWIPAEREVNKVVKATELEDTSRKVHECEYDGRPMYTVASNWAPTSGQNFS